MNSVFLEHWGEWLIVFGMMVFLVYTAVVIKEERQSYLDSSHPTPLKGFTFLIPSWWGLIKQSERELSYERQDTRYEWHASFNWNDGIPENSIEEQFVDKMKEMKLEFDPDTSIIKNPSDFKDHPAMKKAQVEIVRMEGTATQNGIDRKYMDCFLIRDFEKKGCLWAISESSVLNGAVEGPYFEEVMLNFSV